MTIVSMGRQRPKIVDRGGEGISEERPQEYWWDVLGKYFPNLYRGWTTTVGQGTEDAYLTSKSRGAELKGTRRSPKVEKVNLALNKEEKKKEGQSSHPFLIECIATT